MKFKVGDKVRIVEIIDDNEDIRIGDVGCIIHSDNSSLPYEIRINRINGSMTAWVMEKQITFLEYTFEDFKKAPVGTKVTFENGETLTKTTNNNSYDFNVFASYNKLRSYNDLENFKDNYCGNLGKIVKIEEPIGYREVYNTKNQVKEMTLAEVCKELGYNVKIVKEEN